MTTEKNIAAPLQAALANKGYETLTPVQNAVIADEYDGQDLLVSAQTGSGKTVAFGLAFASSLLNDEGHLVSDEFPSVLVIAPTRELALQVKKELDWLYALAGAKVISCVGGMDMRDERRALGRGAHIVVGTPGRLVDHIRRGSLDMTDLQSVVLDEADEMLNMGFREELEEILTAAPEERRTLMFSATVSKPIARLAENYQRDAVRVNTVSERSSHVDIEYQALSVVPEDVEKAIINLLLFHDAPNAIVFCSRREAVNKLTARLNNRGFSVVALSGELSQKERNNALLAMRDGRARVCVATDVAARGLDLPGLDLVIHADLPRDREALLHRSGRTGRAGRKGLCALIVPFRARRRTERLLQDAGVDANWTTPPGPLDVEGVLNDRLVQNEMFSAAVSDEEIGLVTQLEATFSAEQLAAAVVRMSRAKSTAPEDLQPVPEKKERSRDRSDRGPRERDGERPPRGQVRPDFENGEWVRLGVGRKNNADPKWLVPMLCKAGGFHRRSIGVIQITHGATHVELTPDAVAMLMEQAGPDQIIDKSLYVERADGPSQEQDDGPRRDGGHRRDRGDRSDRAERRGPPKSRERRRPSAEHSSDGPPKKKRVGPKKPRGPNGEKKRVKKPVQ